MKKDKMYEIRRLLGDRFHLCEEISFGEDICKWSLFYKYDDLKVYFSPDNKKVMSSETNTIDELYEFAKNHYKMNIFSVLCKSLFAMTTALCVVSIINFLFIGSHFISGYLIGADVIIFFVMTLTHLVHKQNHKLRMRELFEFWRRNYNDREEKED